MKNFQSVLILILCLIVSCSSPLSAQNLKAHEGTVKDAYNFWFYTPAKVAPAGYISTHSADGRKPLVIFLHGASLCGRNLKKVRTYGTLDALSRGLKLDAYVLAPQCPGSAWVPARVNKLIDWAVKNYNVDTNRIYVLGMSLGGYGTLDMAAAYPDRIAAAMGLCGGATSRNLAGLCQVPLCIMHGTGDRAVAWTNSQAVVDIMRSKEGVSRLIYKLLPKRTHGDLARYLYSPDVYNWLFKHSLTDPKRPVNRSYKFSFSALSHVYKDLGKADQTIMVDDGVDDSLTPDATPDNLAAEMAAEDQEIKGVLVDVETFVNDTTTLDASPEPANEPATTVTKPEEPTVQIHVVKEGEFLERIARQHQVTVDHLLRLNGLTRESILQIGQKIKY